MDSQPAATPEQVHKAVPFFAVADMDASLAYYVDGLGFAMGAKWVVDGRVRWCSLKLGGAELMLQETRPESGLSVGESSDVGKGVAIYFMCRDALALYREFQDRGVDAGRPFVGNAMWVTSLTDPDGYSLFFESPTDAPEESVYEG